MADDSHQAELRSIDGVIMTAVGEDGLGRPEFHVVLDRTVAELPTALPRYVDGLPVRVFEQKAIRIRGERMVIVDRAEAEVAELQGEVLLENLWNRGAPSDFEAVIEHLVLADGSRADLVHVIEEGLRRYPTRSGILDRAVAVGFGLARRGAGAHDAVAAIAKALAKAAGPHHVPHYNAAQMFAMVGSKRAAKREYKAALEYARSDEDRADALEGLTRLRGS
jgi:hypothetical protein